MKLYGCKAVESLIAAYCEKEAEILTIEEGSLGYGFMILYGDGLKTAIIKEHYINTWKSGHTIRMYNETPRKYAALIEQYA